LGQLGPSIPPIHKTRTIPAILNSGLKWQGPSDELRLTVIGIAFKGEEMAAMTNLKKAVVYARFSSDLQKDQSVDDQVALCEKIAERNGYRVIKVFKDRAKSGASMFERDGLLELMTAAKRRSFDAVIVEHSDRLSRDQEDLPSIYKRLRFNEIKIIDQNGELTEVHIGVGGIVNSMFLKTLGEKVRRGHSGRVREGKFPGTVTYGYKRVPGKPGEREIDDEHAKIVKRIFTEYASGKTTRDIAAGLTRDRIPTPSGGAHWNHQTFTRGSGGRRGMIGNRLYIGELIWNANRTVMNPEDGKKVKRRGKAEDVIKVDVPHLRIISQTLWDQANGLCQRRAEHKFGAGGKRPQQRVNKREHLLAGMLSCGACGGHMRIAQVSRDGGPRVACAAAHQLGTCSHRKSYDMGILEATVLRGAKANLTNPKALAEYTKAYHARWFDRQKEVRSDRDETQRALNRATTQIDRIVTAISDSDEPVKALVEKLKRLESERAGLSEKLRLIEADGDVNVIALHPAAIDKFAANIETIHAALTDGNMVDAIALMPFRFAFRNIFDRFVVHPTGKRRDYEVTPFARLSAIMGIDLFPAMRSTEEMLSEQGVACTDFGGPENTGLPNRNRNDRVISLGRWRAAA
jgi:site-specific DNA recombinase